MQLHYNDIIQLSQELITLLILVLLPICQQDFYFEGDRRKLHI